MELIITVDRQARAICGEEMSLAELGRFTSQGPFQSDNKGCLERPII